MTVLTTEHLGVLTYWHLHECLPVNKPDIARGFHSYLLMCLGGCGLMMRFMCRRPSNWSSCCHWSGALPPACLSVLDFIARQPSPTLRLKPAHGWDQKTCQILTCMHITCQSFLKWFDPYYYILTNEKLNSLRVKCPFSQSDTCRYFIATPSLVWDDQ